MNLSSTELPLVVVGAGPAGLAAANTLLKLGHRPIVLEKEALPGGKLSRWHQLFPGFVNASDLKDELLSSLPEIRTQSEICAIRSEKELLQIETTSGEKISAKGAVWASGFRVFDARRKEEYGYGLYRNVLTSAEVEERLARGEQLASPEEEIRRIGIIHCVGSRDEKAGNNYCSKVCCICAVKQAIELKKLFPKAEIFNFYMDLRLFGKGYEELYREAQMKWKVNFIRGRVSELAEDQEGRIRLKTEDTLTGTPLKMTLDRVVLMVGMEGQPVNFLSAENGKNDDGFQPYAENFINENSSSLPNVMLAGACKGPSTVLEAIQDGKAAALALHEYLCSNSEK